MRKFALLKDGSNEALLAKTKNTVTALLGELFDPEDLTSVEDLHSFPFGSATIQIQVLPWHAEDVLVRVFSYLVENVDPSKEGLCEQLLRLNATVPLGAFSLVFDGTIMFSCSLAGNNLDKNELLGALQTVAAYADQYDDILKAFF
jgi:hypothetical protein